MLRCVGRVTFFRYSCRGLILSEKDLRLLASYGYELKARSVASLLRERSHLSVFPSAKGSTSTASVPPKMPRRDESSYNFLTS